MSQQQKKSLMTLSAAVCVALALGAPGAMAGVVVDNGNSSCLDGKDTVACVGAWNLSNVQVDLIRLVDGSTFGSFNPVTGFYDPMVVGDSFVSNIYRDASATGDPTHLMAKLSGKVWPVGEPTGIKAVNSDKAVKNGKPENCLINTAYLEGAYLDATSPSPVICSSDFQSHKRFKIAMQPATVTSVSVGTEAPGEPIDLEFNTTDSTVAGTITPYQVFSKINNYTGKRLAGYKIEVGQGVGATFATATQLGITDKLYLSLGYNEDYTSTSTPWGNLFDADGLATFSHGLFGAKDGVHFLTDGFFSTTTAYYSVDQGCTATAGGVTGDASTCTQTVSPDAFSNLPASDTIYTVGVLSSNYTNLFGSWLPSAWAPEGIFFDDDNDPSTDPVLMAWWNGKEWLKGQADNFAPVTQTELNAWASDSRYSEDVIEDVLNLGINYIVHVGNLGNTSFTIRIIPIVAADQTEPKWVGTTPKPLVVSTSSSGGGGCTVGGDGRFDPIFPALLLAGLGFLGLRRFSRKS